MSNVRMEVLEQLLSAEGRDVLETVAGALGQESELALGTRLRRTYDAELVAAAMTQVGLRKKAEVKFGAAAQRMLFTTEALEQATRQVVADHRAERVARAGLRSAVDLGCGIGGDLIALARTGRTVHGVDLDPVRARIAQANLDALGLPGRAEWGDAITFNRSPFDVAFVDPARRNGFGRTFDPLAYRPAWDFVTRLLSGFAVAKVAPGISHDIVPKGVEAEWVSDRGSLVEACLWGSPLAEATRRATVLPSGATCSEADDPGPDETRPVGAFLYEPDDAVIRAHLVTVVCGLTDGWLLDRHIAYVSSDRYVDTPLARAYEVLDELPYREKQLKRALVERGIGTLTIKKRGVQIVPEELVRRLRLGGDVEGTLVMTRADGEGRAFLVRPVPRNAPLAGDRPPEGLAPV